MIYTYEECCGQKWERICSLAAYEACREFACPVCGRVLARRYTPPRIFTKKFEPFISPVDGALITNSRELVEHNKRNRVVQLHEGYDEAAVKKFTETDWQKPLAKEDRKDLDIDLKAAVQKLEEGYTPTPAPYTEEIPDA